MKRIFLLLIIAFMIVNLGLYAQEGTTQTEPKLRLKVVYEKTFQDTIVDVIFDTATVSITKAKAMGWKDEAFDEEERVKGKATISYPRILMTGRGEGNIKEIIFYSKSGQVKRRIHVSKTENVIRSEEGHYILKAKRYNEFNLSQQGAVLYDWNGNIVWEKNKGYFNAVSDSGYSATGFVSVDGTWYPFKIYNVNGILSFELKEINDILPSFFNAGGFFSGKYYIFGSGTIEKSIVYIYSCSEKKIKFKTEFTGYVVKPNIKVLNTGIIAYIYQQNNDRITFLHWNGKMEWNQVINPKIKGTAQFLFKSRNLGYIYMTGGTIITIEKGIVKSISHIKEDMKLRNNYGVKASENKIYIYSLEQVE